MGFIGAFFNLYLYIDILCHYFFIYLYIICYNCLQLLLIIKGRTVMSMLVIESIRCQIRSQDLFSV